MTHHVQVVSLEQLFGMGSFVPEAVHREFQWDQRKVALLLDDLDRDVGTTQEAEATDGASTEVEDKCFLGSIIVKQLNESVLQVVDGLQRLTALTILLAVLRDLSPTGEADRLNNLIITEHDELRLQLSESDRTLSQQVQRRGEAIKTAHSEVSTMGQRIRAAARLYRDAIRAWDSAHLKAFIERLLNNVEVVVLET